MSRKAPAGVPDGRALQEILYDIRAAPTIMPLADELAFIAKLARMSDEELLSALDVLLAILERLQESHTGGAIFEVTDDTHSDLLAFAGRLRQLARLADVERAAGLSRVADDLAVVFPERFKSPQP